MIIGIFSYLLFVFIFMTVGMFLFLILFWSIENLYDSFKEYFFPKPQLPYEIMEQIYHEANEVVWDMHRVGDEPDFGKVALYQLSYSRFEENKYTPKITRFQATW